MLKYWKITSTSKFPNMFILDANCVRWKVHALAHSSFHITYIEPQLAHKVSVMSQNAARRLVRWTRIYGDRRENVLLQQMNMKTIKLCTGMTLYTTPCSRFHRPCTPYNEETNIYSEICGVPWKWEHWLGFLKFQFYFHWNQGVIYATLFSATS